ncbi:ZIP Zinc transporter [Trichostrongylus colubriformis]|uniref:ZIP Zinc transporter n=1 Tax=Trichostrongylus colubriformis TaxID=6319 RepID=A0AAN8FMS7_TRICO
MASMHADYKMFQEIMEGIGFLTVLSGAMFVGSYFAGSVPMMFSMSESKMRMVSIFGAGLLLGTALSVIIPEGVEALYTAQSEKTHSEISNVAKAKAILEDTKPDKGELPRIVPEVLKNRIVGSGIGDSKTRKKRDESTSGIEPPSTEVPVIRRKRDQVVVGQEGSAGDPHSNHEPHHGHAHQQIGYPLVFGFIFMLLVDQISNAAWSKNDRSGRNRISVSATIGLVVHAAADGIALGSASTINKSDVQLIVFVAIMLHKAPAAFGLVSFLLMEGIDVRNARKHLLVFSFAAPFAAVVTFAVVESLGRDSIWSSESSTGVLMLFSAGTFLFVATVHVLPELANRAKSVKDYMLVVDAQSPATAGHSHSGGTSFTIKELLAIIGGAVVPALLSSGHSHSS